jgi:hypothetical protein
MLLSAVRISRQSSEAEAGSVKIRNGSNDSRRMGVGMEE